LSKPAEPLCLFLLAPAPAWAVALRACLAAMGGQPPALLEVTPAELAGHADTRNGVLLSTVDGPPAGPGNSWPVVLLLEQEPPEAPIGVSDWLVLDSLNVDTLRRCLRHVRERGVLQNTLQRLAQHDPLTGVVNRQGFQALLAARLDENDGRGVALGHFDLDNFRYANDALGHQAGDRLILQVVARLNGQLDGGDQLARLGSDEFALLIDTRRDPGRAEALAELIIEAMADPYWIDGESLLLGCSLGIAQARLHGGADSLMWHAHIAMQQAKSLQGCTYHLYNERVHRDAQSVAELESELRRALRRDELELHYQPRLDLHTGATVGLEALVRWRHAERGLLPPSEFVPLAEQNGMIVPLGYWVIARALRDMQALRERGIGPLHMAINLSFRQFQDSQLLATLGRLISEHGVDARWLEFELTETAVMRRNDQVKGTMDALGQLGVRFSLDDFGTGFSSFVHLNNLPIDLLKVDKSFVGEMESREENRKLVHAMIHLAHNLQLHVVAEGVETPEQLQLLRGYGCDQVQGYLISRPLPLPELVAYLQAGQAGLALAART
jgi:diguanylate cyclase (GGDEF)-like protein